MQSTRVVIGLSTIPSRCDKLEETLVSLAAQTYKVDVIYISVPRESSREHCAYPIKSLAKLAKRVVPNVGRVLVVDEDYGPLTKLMGPLLQESDPSTLIISVDYDQKYDAKMVETLVAGSKEYPNAAICLCGHVVGKFPNIWGFRCSRKDLGPLNTIYLKPGTGVDIVSGWCGVLYPRGIFGTDIPNPAMEDMRKNTLKILHRHDDLYISAWLDILKIPKYVVAYKEKHYDASLDHATKNSLSLGDAGATPIQGIKHANEFWSVVRALRAKGLLVSNLRVKWYKSTVTLTTVASLVAIGLAVGIVVYYSKTRPQTPALTPIAVD
jgi:hypothetical protein